MIKIGVIGLGNIAQKAYLPVYAQLQDQFEWHLVTRNAEKLEQIQQRFGFSYGTTNQDDLIKAGVKAVFIHTPTPTHYQIIKKFLSQKINVFVDKPVSENIAEVEELYQLAETNGVLLTAGFNRRFAPMHQKLNQVEKLHSVKALKTRENEQQATNFAVFDLMIHVVDLVQFAMGSTGVQYVNGQIFQDDHHRLVSAEMTLINGQTTGVASVDMQAGVNCETIQAVGTKGIATVENLRQATIHSGTQTVTESPSDWQTTLETRGFKPLIESFLQAVITNGKNPVSPDSSILSHRLCMRLITEAKVIE